MVELHVEFEVVVTVAFTRAHSLQTPIVGVTGHIQLPVGQLAPGSVVLVLIMPFVISDSNRRKSSSDPEAHGQFRTYQLGPAVVPSLEYEIVHGRMFSAVKFAPDSFTS